MWVASGLPGGSGSSLWYMVTYSFVTLAMLSREELGTMQDAYWYHRFSNVYAPWRSVFPIAGSRHTPISDAAFSALRR